MTAGIAGDKPPATDQGRPPHCRSVSGPDPWWFTRRLDVGEGTRAIAGAAEEPSEDGSSGLALWPVLLGQRIVRLPSAIDGAGRAFGRQYGPG
jgi:hypothetical protein